MLQDNLTRIRKARGLTQEALAVKLHVVRQTVSKWENGTAVPDADMLIRLAEALETSVSALLGGPEQTDPPNPAAIARSLAEINEQLAARNRQSRRVLRVLAALAAALLLFSAVLILLNLSSGKSASDGMTVRTLELDEDGVPLFSQLGTETESALTEYFSAGTFTASQLTDAWGPPLRAGDGSLSWALEDGKRPHGLLHKRPHFPHFRRKPIKKAPREGSFFAVHARYTCLYFFLFFRSSNSSRLPRRAKMSTQPAMPSHRNTSAWKALRKILPRNRAATAKSRRASGWIFTGRSPSLPAVCGSHAERRAGSRPRHSPGAAARRARDFPAGRTPA